MSSQDFELIKEKLAEFVNDHSDLLICGVFGSFAKGTAKPTSDVDICVAKKAPFSPSEKIQLIGELSLLLSKEVDLVDLRGINGIILQEALHSSVWIKKDTEAFAAVLKRMLFDQADFQPYYNRMLKAKRERFLK